ncbi:hypothetical protein [Moraxella equi]|uniref:Uncharacterized protein n=1 Tax=Moraxella equi TaxID=60442 RepID=A0A378QQF0_9GAMM|nr:hypothetical protein [Moraxella equi]OPH38234.1 hypothetical protein B5J93_06730 [Moraxella equi]STZ03097.1 Uncharacterised protein [Moraxella equi]
MNAGLKIYKDGKPIFDTQAGAVRILGMYYYGQLTHRSGEVKKIPLPDVGGGEIFALFVNSKERLGSDNNAGTSASYYYIEDNVLHVYEPNYGDRLILGAYYDRTS